MTRSDPVRSQINDSTIQIEVTATQKFKLISSEPTFILNQLLLYNIFDVELVSITCDLNNLSLHMRSIWIIWTNKPSIMGDSRGFFAHGQDTNNIGLNQSLKLVITWRGLTQTAQALTSIAEQLCWTIREIQTPSWATIRLWYHVK